MLKFFCVPFLLLTWVATEASALTQVPQEHPSYAHLVELARIKFGVDKLVPEWNSWAVKTADAFLNNTDADFKPNLPRGVGYKVQDMDIDPSRFQPQGQPLLRILTYNNITRDELTPDIQMLNRHVSEEALFGVGFVIYTTDAEIPLEWTKPVRIKGVALLAAAE